MSKRFTVPLVVTMMLLSVVFVLYPQGSANAAASGCDQNSGAGCFKKGTRPHIVRRYYNYAPQLHDADYQALKEVLEK
jgi:hypothetical protein